jgi:HlyD family secretion protein
VWVLKEGQPSRVVVKTGLSDGSYTQVIEGELAEGDLIIVDRTSEGGSSSGRPAGPGPGQGGQGQGMGGMRRMF